MRVNKIINSLYKTKDNKRYISSEAKDGVQVLLTRMNRETKYYENSAGTDWHSDILSSLSIGKNKFSDNRFFILPTKHSGNCSLYIGKRRLDIDSLTGEIVSFDIGAFTSWRCLLKRADKFINNLVHNFDNPKIVSQNRFEIRGYTGK